jgi:hypothetical protein
MKVWIQRKAKKIFKNEYQFIIKMNSKYVHLEKYAVNVKPGAAEAGDVVLGAPVMSNG